MTILDSKINALQPGQEIELSRTETGYCTAERSTDGKILRFIRYRDGGSSWSIFQTRSFSHV